MGLVVVAGGRLLLTGRPESGEFCGERLRDRDGVAGGWEAGFAGADVGGGFGVFGFEGEGERFDWAGGAEDDAEGLVDLVGGGEELAGFGGGGVAGDDGAEGFAGGEGGGFEHEGEALRGVDEFGLDKAEGFVGGGAEGGVLGDGGEAEESGDGHGIA